MKFSDYIVYVDESGGASLKNYSSKYPVFVLSLCIFNKRYYREIVSSRVQDLKFKYFGHDMVVLHERDILKNTGQFKGFSKELQNSFLDDISELMINTNFVTISCVIHKDRLLECYPDKDSSYHNLYGTAIKFSLERLFFYLREKKQLDKKTFVIFERRGLNEDKKLLKEFMEYCSGLNAHHTNYPFEPIIAPKSANSAGLQFADLIARPIGNHVLNPEQTNRAFSIIEHKFYCRGGRRNTGKDYRGYGLKVFP